MNQTMNQKSLFYEFKPITPVVEKTRLYLPPA